MLEQHDQHVERLRRDGDETTVPPQRPLDGIDNEWTEGVPTVAGRSFQFGVAHAAPLPAGRSRTLGDAVEVSMGPRAKSIAFASSVHVLQRDTTVTRVDAVPHAAFAHETLDRWQPVIGTALVSVLHRATPRPFNSFHVFSGRSIDGGRDVSGTFRPRTGDRCAVLTMSFAVEFLSGPQVLMLRVYAPITLPERRTAVEIIRVHGCYRQGVPLLLDSTETASS